MKKFNDFKLNEKWNNTLDDKKDMISSIYDMYGDYINKKNVEEHDILSFVYRLIKEKPELLETYFRFL